MYSKQMCTVNRYEQHVGYLVHKCVLNTEMNGDRYEQYSKICNTQKCTVHRDVQYTNMYNKQMCTVLRDVC